MFSSLPNDQDPVKLRKEIQAAVEEQAGIQVTDIKLIDDKYYHKACFIHTTVSRHPRSVFRYLIALFGFFLISLAPPEWLFDRGSSRMSPNSHRPPLHLGSFISKSEAFANKYSRR